MGELLQLFASASFAERKNSLRSFARQVTIRHQPTEVIAQTIILIVSFIEHLLGVGARGWAVVMPVAAPEWRQQPWNRDCERAESM